MNESSIPKNTAAKSLQSAITEELDRHRRLGKPFKIKEIAEALSLGKSTVSRYSCPYVAELANELLKTVIDSSDAYERWRRDFETFRFSIQGTARAKELIRRFLRLTIEDLYRKGEVTFTKAHAITGGLAASLRDEIKRWETETGHKASRPKTWRDLARASAIVNGESDPMLSISSRELVHSDLDSRRKLGVPFKIADVVESTGCSAGTVSHYSRHYVKSIAEELLNMSVSSGEEYETWMREFNTFQHSLRNTSKRKSILLLQIELAIEELHRQNIPINYSEVFRRTGSNSGLIRLAIEKWEKKTGNKTDKGKAWKTITLQMVLSLVHPTLHAMPLTFLEATEMGKPFNDKQLRMIFSIRQPKLRNTAFFVMTFADGNRRNDIAFFSSMGRYLLEANIADIDELDPDRFYRQFHDGEILKKENTAKRGRVLQTYFRLLLRQEDYLRKLTHEQRAAFEPYRLRKVTDHHFWRKSTIHHEVRSEQKIRRKKATDIVHEKFYLLRDVAERRRIQLSRLRAAYFDGIEHHRKSNCELPFTFSITDETVLPNGSVKSVTHHFRLWNASALRSVHEKTAGDFYDRASTYQKSISEQSDLYFLSYEGGHHESDPGTAEPYWFIDQLRIRGMGIRATREFQSSNGYAEDVLKLPERTDWDVAVNWWHQRLHHDLGLVFIPPNALMRNGLIGHAAVQIMTKTGARMNEFLQIRLMPEHLKRVTLPDNRETIAFWAIPKGRASEEPFYIDDRCMKALHAWWSFQRDSGEQFDAVAPTRGLDHKLKPAPYLWQHRGRHLSHGNVNACMRFLLHGLALKDADGNPVNLSSHLLRHGFATELRALGTPIDVIALLMNQRDTVVTEYYSKPTPARLVALQRKIFESRVDLSRQHIRAPDQVRKQIEAVKDKVGALIPVVGGTCTVANECPAKFACIGCAGNAPDPGKRSQVIELKRAYTGMVSLAETQNLPAERRKALDILANCDDVLAEMDLMEAADRAAEEPVKIMLGAG